MEPWINLAERCRLHRISSADFHTLLTHPWPYEELGAASVTFDEEKLIKAILANKHINRTISPTNQERLRTDMAAGGWVDETGESIILSHEMRLADGENRLTAALETRTAIQSVVVWGVPVEKRSAMNIGKKRSGADMLAIEGISDPSNTGAALRVLSRLENGSILSLQKVIPDNRIVPYYYERQTIRYSLTAGRKAEKFVPPSIGTAVHYCFHQHDETLADRFFQQLATGEHLDTRDPLHVLRELLIARNLKDRRSKKQWGPVEQARLAAQLILTWNAIRQQRRIAPAGLAWEEEKAFPEIL